MKVLIGEETPSGGVASLGGINILDGASRQNVLSYCAQFDSLVPGLSARQHLWFFGRLMGVPNEHLEVDIPHFIREVGLEVYADRPADTYSG